MSDQSWLPPGLPVPPDDGASDQLPGLPMPRISLTDTAGRTVRMNALGAGRTVLYLYPLTDRPGADFPAGWAGIPGALGCATQACDFRDHHRDLGAAGAARVLGLSSQGTAFQSEFVERPKLPFSMLSDPDLRLADALGLPTFEAGGATFFKRLTLIVRDDLIERVFYPIFAPDKPAQQVLSWLRATPA